MIFLFFIGLFFLNITHATGSANKTEIVIAQNPGQAKRLHEMREFLKMYRQGNFPDSAQRLMHNVVVNNVKGLKDETSLGDCVNFTERISGDTPLICAARLGHADIVSMLLATNKISNINHKNKWGCTALGVATKLNNINQDIVYALLQAGADSETAEGHHDEVKRMAQHLKEMAPEITVGN